VFVPGRPFQPSLVFAGKAGAYPNEAPLKCKTRVGSWTSPQGVGLLGTNTLAYYDNGPEKFYRIGHRSESY
jgi:hypothetical protein